MAEWLEQASQWHEMYCHNLEVMSSNSSRVELGVRCTSVLIKSYLNKKYNHIAKNSTTPLINIDKWDSSMHLYMFTQ